MKINIKNIVKQYDKKVVLDIETLEIESGKITGITGPNGSGKSTLLNIIGGLDREYSGKVTYDGKILNENIIYPLKVRKYDKIKMEELLNKTIMNLEIEDLMELRADKLSGGESQKVALARALVFNPDILLLDEFTSNIDPEYIVTMEKEVIRFHEETKATIIIVTHNIEQSIRLCHNIINLDKGKVVL